MNLPDFKDWYAYHASAFPSVVSWLAKYPETAARNEVSQQTIMAAWARTMGDTDFKLAKQATDILARGDEEFSKPNFECHPKDVRAIAMKLWRTSRGKAQQKTLDGEPVFDCGYCRDTGIVEVYVPKFLEWACDAFQPGETAKPGERLAWQRDPRLKERPAGIPFSCSIACTCARGGPKQKGMRGYVFNPERHIVYDPFAFWPALERMRELLASRGGF